MRDNCIILMGEYTIVNRDGNNQSLIIESPGAQTCVVLILKSETKIAVAHIDSPVDLAKSLSDIFERFRGESIVATLIGGDAGLPIVNSRSIYQKIYAELNKNKINYTHEHYSINLLPALLPIGYFLLRLTGYLGPESYLYSFFCLGSVCLASVLIKSGFEKSFDVEVIVGSGEVQVKVNNLNNSVRVLRQVQRSNQARFDRFKKRFNQDPLDATTDLHLYAVAHP